MPVLLEVNLADFSGTYSKVGMFWIAALEIVKGARSFPIQL